MTHWHSWTKVAVVVVAMAIAVTSARADVGDPQVRTDHLWYPGELACSTFERLFATQAELYERVVGVKPVTEEQKAVASWLWRNTHYRHGEEGVLDLWGQGFTRGFNLWTREYWTGLYAHGFALCGTTHAQWTAEMEALLGHNRGRTVGVDGHNSFEVFLTGGAYGAGKWVLLDHDLSTVIFDREGKALLSLAEIQRDWKRLTDRGFAPRRQHGWLVCGLHPDDGSAYKRYQVAESLFQKLASGGRQPPVGTGKQGADAPRSPAFGTDSEYLAGYSGVPPLVHLRRGEKLRRYLQPGLDDGKTFVFWGRNYNTGGIPGPERANTWVNQPDKMHGSRDGAGHRPGQARYGNAVYTYQPDFAGTDYREGVIAEDDQQVTFEFYTPYIIAATPPNKEPWGIYQPGCRNGLLLHGRARCPVSLSTDQGRSWQDCGAFADGMDLTDRVKGFQQYWVRFQAAAKALAKSGLTMTTVCQANPCIMPRLKDNGSRVRFLDSGRAVLSAGANIRQAEAHVIAGKFGTPNVTLEVAAPRKETALTVYAAAHVLSGSPPQAEVKYQIDFSTDAGKTWRSMVKDWSISRRGDEPRDFWSQSLCWGKADCGDSAAAAVRVRFRSNGGKSYARGEVHLVYRTRGDDTTTVTFDWTDAEGAHRAAHRFASCRGRAEPIAWTVPTGRQVQTRWVEFQPD